MVKKFFSDYSRLSVVAKRKMSFREWFSKKLDESVEMEETIIIM